MQEIKVFFACALCIDKLGQKYRGFLTITNLEGENLVRKKFWFLLHFPYQTDSEIMFFTDKEMENVFAEGMGNGIIGRDMLSGKPTIGYDFYNLQFERIGIANMLLRIIRNCVLSTETDIEELKEGPFKSRVHIADTFHQEYDDMEYDLAKSILDFLSSDS